MVKNTWLWLIGAVLVIIFFLQKQEIETFSLFPQYQDSGKIHPSSSAYTEGDTFMIDASPQAIFIDGKLYFRGNIGTRADECGSMNTPPVSIPNSAEIPIELTPGMHTVEGWASYQTGTQLKCGREMQMAYFRFNINVFPKPCLLQPNQLIAAEMFSPGITINENTLRYPVAQWCSEHPLKVYEKNSRTFTNRYDLFNKLKNQESLTVPSGETWMVFYVIDNNAEIPAMCDPTLYYDVDKKICTDVSGILTVCSYGTFDPSLGLCLVQADDSEPFCEIGRYDLSLNKCIYNPPLYPLCDFCFNLGCEYNYATDRCEYNAPLVGLCPEGTIKVGEHCEYTLPSIGTCPIGTTKNGDKCEFTLPSEGTCPSGTTKVGNVCQFTLPSEGVCPSGMTKVGNVCQFNLPSYGTCPQGMAIKDNHCEFELPSVGICPINTINKGNYCEYALTTQPCPPDFLFENGKCVKYPSETISCIEGYSYNSTLDSCVKYVSSSIQCLQGGIYEDGQCIIKVENSICPKGVLSDDKKSCIISPNYQTSACVQGTYSTEKNACIIQPNLDYLCLIGTLSEDKTSCVIYAQTVYKCQEGFAYEKDLDKCVSYPEGKIKCPTNYNYNNATEMCEFTPSVFHNCPSNTEYNEERDVCQYNPQIGIVCPESSTYSAEQDKCLESKGIISTTVGKYSYLIIGGLILVIGYLIYKRK